MRSCNPHENDFVLTLEGDDQNNDVDVMMLLNSSAPNIARINALSTIPTEGDDVISSDASDDLTFGNNGNDQINGNSGTGSGTGNYSGGSGRDEFHFERSERANVVKNFENNEGILALDNFGFFVRAVLDLATEARSNVDLVFGDDGKLTIESMTINQLQNDLFWFD